VKDNKRGRNWLRDKRQTRMLLDCGARVDMQDNQGRTAAAMMARKKGCGVSQNGSGAGRL
jgi:hypothetical protein